LKKQKYENKKVKEDKNKKWSNVRGERKYIQDRKSEEVK
jgi:hypothetical protein